MANKYHNLLLDQTKDLIWAVDHKLNLVYTNKAYLKLLKEVTGEEKKLNTTILVEGFGEGHIEKWKAYYLRALSGENFEVEEHFFNPATKEMEYGQIAFTPIRDEIGEIFTVACRKTDITPFIKQKSHASQLMNASLDVFCSVDEAGKFVYVSAASAEHWGYPPEELIGKPYRDLIVNEDLEKTDQVAAEIMEGKQFKSFSNRFRKKQGGIAYNLWSARWDDDSKLMYCVAMDKKEVLEQQQLMQHSEERFKALVQEGADMTSILDPEGNYIYVSPACNKILGITSEECLGKSIFNLIHPEDQKRILEAFKKIGVEKTVELAPFRIKNKEGEFRWIESVWTNMLDKPSVNGIVANSRDVTKKIHESHQLKLFEKLVNNTKDSIIITEAESLNEPGPVITYVNDAFIKSTGYTTKEVIGQNPRFLQGPKTNFDELSLLGEKLRRFEPTETTVLNYKKNGEEFWVNFTVTPVANEQGRVTHFISVQRDVTARKTRELEKDLLAKVSDCFNGDELPLAGKKLCKVLKDFWGFDVVELWCPNMEQTHLSRIAFKTELKEFFTVNPNFTKNLKGEGLKGKVWQQEKQLLWDQEKIDALSLRKNEAQSAGIECMLGVPLKHNNQINGILVFGAKCHPDEIKKVRKTINQLETFIGSEINRKRLEDDLKQLYQTIPDILCITDLKGRILKINPAGLELLGYPEDEILLKPFDMFVHPDDMDKSFKELEKLKEGISNFQFENRCITKVGNVVWLSWNCNVSLQDGLIYAAAKDITEEKKLRLLNQQANTMAKIGYWELDVEKGTVFWSDMVHHLHETDPEHFLPDFEASHQFYREDYRNMVFQIFEQAIHTGENFDFEAVIVTRNLKERWVRAIGGVERVGGVTKRIFGSFQDIHETKSLEVQLKTVTDNIPGVIFQGVTHSDGRKEILYISEGSQMLWGLPPEECKKNPEKLWQQVVSGGDIEAVIKKGKAAVKNNSTYFVQFRNACLDGTIKWYEGRGMSQRLPDDSIVWNLLIIDITEIKVYEARYKEALAKKATILDSISDGFYALDENWNFTYFNREAENQLKTDAEGVLGKNIWEKLPFLKGSIHQETYERVAVTGQRENFEYHSPRDDSWNDISVYPFERGISVFFQNISERRKAEEELIEAYQEKNEILESISDAFYTVDMDWIITYWNKEAEAILGRTRNEMIGNNLWEIFPTAIDTPYHTNLHQVMETGEALSFERYTKTLDLWLEITVYPSELGLSIYSKDITLRKEADIRLMEANERFELATKATDDVIWDWDIEKDTFYRSNNIQRLFGEVTNSKTKSVEFWQNHLHPEDLERINESVENALKDPYCERWEMRYQANGQNGEEFFILDRGIIVRNTNGKAIRMVGAMTDLTKQKTLENELYQANAKLKTYAKELERSNEELEQFAFITSHDLQEPLRMITGFMSQLERKYRDQLDEKAQQYIHFAMDGATRMKQIIQDLLLYSRANSPSEEVQQVNLNEIVSEYTQLRRKLIAEKKASVSYDKLPVIETYKAPITQIFHGLLDNALKYVKEDVPPHIEIHAKEKDTVWEFAIKDNGIGIEEKFYDKIFVIFQRLHNRSAYDGTGIGLSIAKRSVEFLGGEIWIESTVGQGTTFYFTIAKKTIV